MNEIHNKILHARPNLRNVSPLAYWIVLILGLFNIVLGVSLFFALDSSRFSSPLLIVNEVLTFHVWGVIFILLGLTKIWSLISNNWKLAKNTLIVGVIIKASWAIALTIRTLISPGTMFINIIWITLALIQTVTYIFFMPPNIQPVLKRGKGEVTRHD